MSTEVMFTSKHKKLQIQTKVETVQFQPSGALGIFKTSNEELINALRSDKEYGKSFGDKPEFLSKFGKTKGVIYQGLNPDGTPKMESVEVDSNVVNGVRTSDNQPKFAAEPNKDELFREYIKLSKIIKKSDEQKTRITELKTELKLD